MVGRYANGLILGLLCFVMPSIFGILQQSVSDKKKFDNLTDVSFTKSALATKARKEKRLDELHQLAALMLGGVIAKIDTAALMASQAAQYNTKAVSDNLRSLIEAARANSEVQSASRYAMHTFMVKYEGLMDNVFRKNVSDLLAGKLKGVDLKIVEKYIKNLKNITLPVYLNKLQTVEAKDLAQMKMVLPDKNQIDTCLARSLSDFNMYYSKVIQAILEVSKLTNLRVPRGPITLGYFAVIVTDQAQEQECPICFEDYSIGEAVLTPCGHKFHKGCILNALKKAKTCPICRMPITAESLISA
jgi:hypothetical protein